MKMVAEIKSETTLKYWLPACSVITIVAVFLRFYDLALKPLHHDEGVNGFFLTGLFRDGVYRYDPANYHGPTLYYISLAFTKVLGLETIPIRMSTAVFGVATVILIFYFRRYIGSIGSLAAALFVAISPGMVFISRYFIHEIFFLFLGLAIVLAILLFIENQKVGTGGIAWMTLLLLVCFIHPVVTLGNYFASLLGTSVTPIALALFVLEVALVLALMRGLLSWDGGRPIYLLLASAAASLMFATKETAFITLGTLAIAAASVWIWQKIYRPRGSSNGEIPEGELDIVTWKNFSNALGSGTSRLLLILAAVGIFAYVWVLFFTSFFTFAEGIQRSIEAYAIWTKTGNRDHTQSGFFGYLTWGMKIEAPIIIASAIGLAIAFLKSRHRVAMFIGLWAFGLFLAYSLIPYKTPWLALNFFLPMCLIAGYGINEIFRFPNSIGKYTAGALSLAAAIVLGYQSWDLNFVNYDNDARPYVYAHTRRGFLDLMRKIEDVAAKSGKANQVRIDVLSPDYWPMVWYVKDFPHAVFHGNMVSTSEADMIVVKKGDQDREAIAKFSSNYKLAGSFELRPGVDLGLLVKNELADQGSTELYKLRSP